MKYSLVFLDDGLKREDAKARYRARRDALLKNSQCPVLLMGVHKDQNEPFQWLLTHVPLFQDPVFHFYTGVNQIKCASLLCPNGEHILFLPKKDDKKIFWEGTHLGSGSPEACNEAIDVTGYDRIEDMSDWVSIVKAYMSECGWKELGVMWMDKTHASIIDHYDTFNAKIFNSLEGVLPKNINELQLEQRFQLDKIDQDNMLEANKRTSDAIVATMKDIVNLRSEQEVSGRLLGELSMRTSKGISFPPIVAGGKNAAILHYHKNDEALEAESLILIDCGLRHHSMPADISRTVPRNGVFNPLQKCLYNIVLTTQLMVEAHIKAGVSLQELNDICWTSIESGLDKHIRDKGGIIKRSYDKGPHGSSYWSDGA
jgi:Xaa-Pro aminopeptidase